MEFCLKRGIVLLNMGGPNSLNEVEMFLRNMFADKYILQTNRLVRFLVGSIIVKKRLKEAQDNYELIGGKSPLYEISSMLADKVEKASGIATRLAMRYVPPFATEALQEFQKNGIQEVILFPMYPQYSTTTTLSSVEDIKRKCTKIGYEPKITVVEPYYNDIEYVKIQVEKILQALGKRSAEDFDLILSAHGLPMSIIKSGDPYEKHVEENVSHIKKYLKERNIIFKNIILAYQSKVGAGEWLQPGLAEVLRRPENMKVLIFPLAFSVDNSETLFELDIEHRLIADKIGYDEYLVSGCPNDDDSFAKFIASKCKTA